MEVNVVWACHEIRSTCQNVRTRHCTGKEKGRNTEKNIGEQNHKMDRKGVEGHVNDLGSAEDREKWRKPVVRCSDAPTVALTGDID